MQSNFPKAFTESENKMDGHELKENLSQLKQLKNVACGILAVWAVTAASPVIAAGQRLPPLSTDPSRCERAFVGNTIGQANGVYDKAIDLRFCDYTNEKSNLKGKSLAAALMSEAKFDGADMSEVVMSKAYAAGASFKGTDFSNAVLDRVNFEKANLQGALFKNTVLSGSTFNEAKLDGAVFEDTIIGTLIFRNSVEIHLSMRKEEQLWAYPASVHPSEDNFVSLLLQSISLYKFLLLSSSLGR
ncbi:Tetratricopeptide repeat-like superfamily protein [Prunus dulcis]|uniref:Tetratricopeptide repeat-like superfamily protein n=1 Tax=Prunus dulcis TaxID=3755 RepID=A0A4Y1R2W7_PRUDU|nr:Tetratricopeptide repeat-like superfamily protein [Prunus dulcis]